MAPIPPAMVAFLRLVVLLFVPLLLRAAPPAPLAAALQQLRDQKSYSWETINSDPGPVAQRIETRRGTVTTVQQNLAPNVQGRIDRQGDMLIRREWADGLVLETVITAAGASATKTPEGWMSDREILTAQSEERLRNRTATPRAVWLRRADRPDVLRPDQELAPLLKFTAPFTATGNGYRVAFRSRAGDTLTEDPDDGEPATTVEITLNLRGGSIRDYELKLEGVRRVQRSRIQVPVSEQRIVVLKYLPISKLDLPPEAREKLAAPRGGPPARTP